jgi:hypothetical protein
VHALHLRGDIVVDRVSMRDDGRPDEHERQNDACLGLLHISPCEAAAPCPFFIVSTTRIGAEVSWTSLG